MGDMPLPATAHAVRALRQHLHQTQEHFGALVGCTVSTVNRWERGFTVPSKMAWAKLREVATANGLPRWGDTPDA